MGLLDSALSGINSMLAAPGSLIQAGASLVGGMLRNQSQADQATQANQFSAQQFANRYQTTVKDMQAAGLNPMLAYQQGASGQPSGQQAVMQDVTTPAVSAYQNSYQTELDRSKAAQAKSSAELNARQEILVNATVEKTVREIDNIGADSDRLRAIVNNLDFVNRNLDLESTNIKDTHKVLFETAWKIASESGLLKSETEQTNLQNELLKLDKSLKEGDVEAMKNMGNFGRNYKELAPVIEVLKDILGIYHPRSSHSTVESTVRRVK